MTDAPTEDDLIVAVKDTLERLQIKPADLFRYVSGLRLRYRECHYALEDIIRQIDDESNISSIRASSALTFCALDDVEDVSHETN